MSGRAIRDLLQGWRYRIRRECAFNPVTAPLYVRALQGQRAFLVQPDTDLLLEGYPRSANTYSVAAFELSNGDGWRLAHHLHSPVNVERAVRFEVPCAVLVREPVAAVASHMVRSPWVTPSAGLQTWARFYGRVLPVADRVVIAEFDQVTSDFGAVITRVNDMFGTAFTPFPRTLERQRAAWSRIDEIERRDTGGTLRPSAVSRPHPARVESRRQALKRLREERYAPMVARARRVYSDLTGL